VDRQPERGNCPREPVRYRAVIRRAELGIQGLGPQPILLAQIPVQQPRQLRIEATRRVLDAPVTAHQLACNRLAVRSRSHQPREPCGIGRRTARDGVTERRHELR